MVEHRVSATPPSTVRTERKAWTTLLTKRSYLPGLLVLDDSLKSTKSEYRLVVMVTDAVEPEVLRTLELAGIPTRRVDQILPKPKHGDGAISNKDSERFRDTWTKLACFALTEYERVVLLDADQLVIQNQDELMTMDLDPGQIAAAAACTCNPRKFAHYPSEWIPENCAHTAANPKTGQPAKIDSSSPPTYHLLNSGTVVLSPSTEAFHQILEELDTNPDVPKMAFPDQDLLAVVYRNRLVPLPYIYNALKPMRACHSDLWRDDKIKNVHYVHNDKPWKSRTVESDVIGSTHAWWWNQYNHLEESWLGRNNGTNTKLDAQRSQSWKEIVAPEVAAAT